MFWGSFVQAFSLVDYVFLRKNSINMNVHLYDDFIWFLVMLGLNAVICIGNFFFC